MKQSPVVDFVDAMYQIRIIFSQTNVMRIPRTCAVRRPYERLQDMGSH